MTLSDACGVIALIGMGLLAAAIVLTIVRKIFMRRGRIQRAEQIKRLLNIFLTAGVVFWILACILTFAQCSQSNH